MRIQQFLGLVVALVLALPAFSQEPTSTNGKYMAGSVPVVDGQVRFSETYTAEGRSAGQIYAALKDFTQKTLVEGKEALPKARITEADSLGGQLVASIEEYLYFKRKAWTMDRVRFSYQIIYHISDGSFTVEMRRLRYTYDDVPEPEELYAEDWITDAEALTRDGKALTKKAGKFRRFTIDRKDEIFRGAQEAAFRN